jgi:hypothetical protein
MRLVLGSLWRYCRLVGSHRLRLRRERVGSSFRLFDGRLYRVFRETRAPMASTAPTSFEVTFRLRLIGSARAAHWLFERLCILTTPFWSGCEGFGTKLWMVDPQSRGYAGIYEWGGVEAARSYLRVLLPILRFVSVPGSVDYRLHADTGLSDFLASRRPPDSF